MAKVALVTGGAVRVGRAISLGAAKAGYDVVVNYHSSGADARELEREIRDVGRDCLLVQGDVSSEDAVARTAEQVQERFGRLDLLVNNASLFERGSLLAVDASEWDRVMAVNVRGPFLTVKHLAPLLEESGGNIVNIVDLSAIEPWTTYPHHSVSKAALLHLTKVMAKSLAPKVRVNAVAPGTVLPPEDTGSDELERERKRTLVGSLGDPEDVVRAVLFLASSPFITGDMILVDGGAALNRGRFA